MNYIINREDSLNDIFNAKYLYITTDINEISALFRRKNKMLDIENIDFFLFLSNYKI